MFRAIIVDDERKSRENLKVLVNDFCEGIKIVGMAENLKRAKQLIDTKNPEVVFLDIRMNHETGFELLEYYKEFSFSVIFVTAYAEYAIRAIKFSAFDYILKPVDIDELKEAVKRLKESRDSEQDMKLKFKSLIENLKSKRHDHYKIALPTTNGLIFVKMEDIIFCEGANNYTIIHTIKGNKYVVSKTLKEYEDLLSQYNFMRIHKSFLINLNEIKEYVRGEGGYVIMNNEKSLGISKRKKEQFLYQVQNMTNPC